MASTAPRPLKPEHEFTETRMTGFGGWWASAAARRGESDSEALWPLPASLVAANGTLADLDVLRTGPVVTHPYGQFRQR